MGDLAIRPRACAVSSNALLCFVQPRGESDQHLVFEVEGHGAPRRFLETDGNVTIEHRFTKDVLLVWGVAPEGRLRFLDLARGDTRDVLPGNLALRDRLIHKDGAKIVFARAASWDDPQGLFEYTWGDERPRPLFHQAVRDVLAVTRDRALVVTREGELWEAPRDKAQKPRKLASLPEGPAGVTATLSPGGGRLALELERASDSPLEERHDLLVFDLARGERLYAREGLEVTRPYLSGSRSSLFLRWQDDAHLGFEDALVRKRDRAAFEADYRRNVVDLASGVLSTEPEQRIHVSDSGAVKSEPLKPAPDAPPPAPQKIGTFLVEESRIRWAATGEVAWEAQDPRVYDESRVSADGRFAAVMDQHLGQLLLLEGDARAVRPVTNEWSHSLVFLPGVA